MIVGFGGSRALHGDPVVGRALVGEMTQQLRALHAELGLDPRHHFLCGQSQLAAGADMAFAEACSAADIALRVVLPEPLERFLHASNSEGRADFNDAQRREVEQALQRGNIVDLRVASQAASRGERFQETNVEIAQTSDVVIVLLPEEGGGRAGGALALRDTASRHGLPVVELRWRVEAGSLFIRRVPGLGPELGPATGRRRPPPQLPDDLDAPKPDALRDAGVTGIPMHVADYLGGLKDASSQHARRHRGWFRSLAFAIVGTHVLATVCAVIAATLLTDAHAAYKLLLLAELMLLLIGQGSHFALHHMQGTRRWAVARLVAEIARSAGAFSRLPVPLVHLFHLPFPDALRPLLRTIELIHLSTARAAPEPWTEVRERYVENRLYGPKGQRHYYSEKKREAEYLHRVAELFFYGSAVAAFAATATKLTLASHGLHLPAGIDHHVAAHVLGALAIILPALAVSALSLDAAYDLGARVHTYEDLLKTLAASEAAIRGADTEAEFCRVLGAIETKLLGETATWASRRSFTGVN